jgi:hypothetical protein
MDVAADEEPEQRPAMITVGTATVSPQRSVSPRLELPTVEPTPFVKLVTILSRAIVATRPRPPNRSSARGTGARESGDQHDHREDAEQGGDRGLSVCGRQHD